MTRIHALSFVSVLLCAVLWLAGCTGGKTVWTAPSTTPQGTTATVGTPPAINPYPVNTPAPGGKAKVALLVPLSGANAALGQAMLSAAQLAMFDAGADNFELMPRDSGASAQSAAESAQGALNDGAQLILGPIFADAVKAVKPLAAQRGVQVIAFSTDTAVAGDNTFLMGFTPASQIERVAAFAASKGIRRASVLFADDVYGNAAERAFSDIAPRAGIKVAATRHFIAGDKDMALVTRDAEAVFMPLSGAQAVTAATNMNAATVRKLGTGLWDDPRTLASTAMEGAWFAAPSPASFAMFEKKFRMTYGTTPPRLASLAYDATALAAVLSKSGKGYGRDVIMNPNGFAGIDGIFRFGPDGVAERGLAVLEIRKGQAVEISPAPRTFQR